MRKIEEGMVRLDGSKKSYLIKLFDDSHEGNVRYVCKAYKKGLIINKQLFEKSFYTILPDYVSMVNSTLVDLELKQKHGREQSTRFREYKKGV